MTCREAGNTSCEWWTRGSDGSSGLFVARVAAVIIGPMKHLEPFITHDVTGMTRFSHERPASLGRAPDHTRRPVDFAVHHDLDLEIHGEHFSATVRLTHQDALDLIMRLSYGMREQFHRCKFVEVTK